MLRTRKALPAMAAKLLCQVAASVAATLIASTIFAALPRATAPVAQASVELTSGGKFAARIPGAEDKSTPVAEARAPLPVLTMVPPQPFSVEAPEDVKPADGAKLADLVARPVRAKTRAPLRADRGRTVEAAVPAIATRPAAIALADSPSVDEGFLPKLGSSARSLWSMTASAGGSLLSRLMP